MTTALAVPQTQHRTLRHSTSTGPQRAFWSSPARFRLFVGGVGSGKTRAGCLEVLRQPPGTTGMVLAPTYPMLRDATLRTFMELVHRGGILKHWHKSEMTVELIDGKTVMFRSADDPDRLRGPNLGWFYLDEGAMMDPDAWKIMIGRLRERPGKAWVTSTPRGRNWLHKEFMPSIDYDTIRSSTRQNPYLPPDFIPTLERSYSQRMLRQEVEGEFIEDVEGALWTLAQIDSTRVAKAPEQMLWVAVGVDPAVTSTQDSDETGIVVAGRAWCTCKGAAEKHYFVLQDATMGIVAPAVWASRAVNAYHDHQANVIVAEVNNGGDLIQTIIRGIDKTIPTRKVHASRGKLTRAEPISMLYEQGRVHHVGTFPLLEDQMCSYVAGAGDSPDRMDALVWSITELSRMGGSAA